MLLLFCPSLPWPASHSSPHAALFTVLSRIPLLWGEELPTFSTFPLNFLSALKKNIPFSFCPQLNLGSVKRTLFLLQPPLPCAPPIAIVGSWLLHLCVKSSAPCRPWLISQVVPIPKRSNISGERSHNHIVKALFKLLTTNLQRTCWTVGSFYATVLVNSLSCSSKDCFTLVLHVATAPPLLSQLPMRMGTVGRQPPHLLSPSAPASWHRCPYTLPCLLFPWEKCTCPLPNAHPHLVPWMLTLVLRDVAPTAMPFLALSCLPATLAQDPSHRYSSTFTLTRLEKVSL